MLKWYPPASKLTPSNGNPHFHFWKYIINTSTFHDDQLWLGMFFSQRKYTLRLWLFAQRRSPQPLQRGGWGFQPAPLATRNVPKVWRVDVWGRFGVGSSVPPLLLRWLAKTGNPILNRLHIFSICPPEAFKQKLPGWLLSASSLIWGFVPLQKGHICQTLSLASLMKKCL